MFYGFVWRATGVHVKRVNGQGPQKQAGLQARTTEDAGECGICLLAIEAQPQVV